MLFNEALQISEEPTDEISHFAGADYLESIFRDGCIKGSQYSIGRRQAMGSKDFTEKDDDPYEFCVVRKAHADKPLKLSLSAGATQILVDKNTIMNIRGIKKPYPIAEIPLFKTKLIQSTIKRIEDETGRDCSDIKAAMTHRPLYTPEQFNEKMPKIFGYARNLVDSIKRDYSEYYRKISHREGEERFDLSRNSIPLSSRYIKFRLAKREMNPKLAGYIRSYCKKDPGLFEKNEVLKQILDGSFNYDLV